MINRIILRHNNNHVLPNLQYRSAELGAVAFATVLPNLQFG